MILCHTLRYTELDPHVAVNMQFFSPVPAAQKLAALAQRTGPHTNWCEVRRDTVVIRSHCSAMSAHVAAAIHSSAPGADPLLRCHTDTRKLIPALLDSCPSLLDRGARTPTTLNTDATVH